MKIILKIAKLFTSIFFRINFINLEKFPKEGKLMICANHKSNWDPVILLLHLPRDIIFMSKKELFNIPIVKWFLTKIDTIPVDRKTPELSTIKKSIKVLNDGGALGIFPQGTRKQYIEEDDAKSGVGLIAYKSNSPVVPIYIKSNYKLFSKVDITIGDLIYPNNIKEENIKIRYDKFSKFIMHKIKEISNES